MSVGVRELRGKTIISDLERSMRFSVNEDLFQLMIEFIYRSEKFNRNLYFFGASAKIKSSTINSNLRN